MSRQDPPEYKVYRSRRRPLSGWRPPADLEGLRKRVGRRREREPRERRGISPGRVFKWLAIAAVFWLLLSLALFFISSSLEGGISPQAERVLSKDSNLLSGSTILVLGSDKRTGESIDESQSGPARADSIMLLHVGFGSVRKLSIPRDSFAQIPGHGGQRINAAYAIGGPTLMIETVEAFMGNGLEVNHLVEVDFEDFPELIDALGGITVESQSRICSPPFDNFFRGLRFKKGENELDGTRALGFARVRKNDCAPGEDDRDRAARQQEVFTGMKDKMLSPGTFFRLPLVSWRGPRAMRTDMQGASLLAFSVDVMTASSDPPAVLEASCPGCGPGGSLVVSEGSKSDAVRQLVEG